MNSSDNYNLDDSSDDNSELIKRYDYINEITDKIFLGELMGGKQRAYLRKKGVTNILSIIDKNACYFPKDFTYKHINMQDLSDCQIMKHFRECLEFIDTSKGKVFVHCLAGISRSATIVIAYLMWKDKLSYQEAYFKVKNKRRYIDPNDGFVKQLQEFEKLLISNNYNLEYIIPNF